jgi:hypothetical protein
MKTTTTKTLHSILSLLIAFISLSSFAQNKFYDHAGDKIRVAGHQLKLSFDTVNVAIIPDNEDSKDQMTAGFGTAAFLSAALPSILDLGFQITNKLIEDNVKKYTNEFSARNSFDQQGVLPSITLTREIREVGTSDNIEALVIKLEPKRLYGNAYIYEVVNIDCYYSGAKVKKEFPYNSYALELKLVFLDSAQSEKKEQETSAILIPMIELGSPKTISDIKTDIFLIPIKSSLAEAHIKVVETNSFKVQAEQLNSIVDNHGEKVQETTKTIINYFVEQAKEEEEEEEESEDEEDSDED